MTIVSCEVVEVTREVAAALLYRHDYDSTDHRFPQDPEGFWMIFEVYCVHDSLLIHRLANYHFFIQKKIATEALK